MKSAKAMVVGFACLGMATLPLGCGGGTPEEVIVEDDYGSSEEGLEEMDDVAEVDGLEDINE